MKKLLRSLLAATFVLAGMQLSAMKRLHEGHETGQQPVKRLCVTQPFAQRLSMQEDQEAQWLDQDNHILFCLEQETAIRSRIADNLAAKRLCLERGSDVTQVVAEALIRICQAADTSQDSDIYKLAHAINYVVSLNIFDEQIVAKALRACVDNKQTLFDLIQTAKWNRYEAAMPIILCAAHTDWKIWHETGYWNDNLLHNLALYDKSGKSVKTLLTLAGKDALDVIKSLNAYGKQPFAHAYLPAMEVILDFAGDQALEIINDEYNAIHIKSSLIKEMKSSPYFLMFIKVLVKNIYKNPAACTSKHLSLLCFLLTLLPECLMLDLVASNPVMFQTLAQAIPIAIAAAPLFAFAT